MDNATYEQLKILTYRNRFIPTPSDERNFVGGDTKNFLKHGFGQIDLLRKYGFQPSSSLLDLGSGIGRLALPATQYLDETGSFYGVDINVGGVAWCHENIRQRYKNFQFAVINARNRHYRHEDELGQIGLLQAELPIPSHLRFDFIAAFSLFTHLQQEETEFYFQKLRHLLVENGKLVASLFIVDEAARSALRAGRALFDFDVDTIPDSPVSHVRGAEGYSNAFACDEAWLNTLAELNGMQVVDVIKSEWRDGVMSQDILVLQRA